MAQSIREKVMIIIMERGGKCEGYTDFIFVALFSKSYFIHVWEENIPQSLFNFPLCYQN